MINLWFYAGDEEDDMQYNDPVPHMPKCVLLDIQDLSSKFLLSISQIEAMEIEFDVVLADILDNLFSEQEAHLYLASQAQEMLESVHGTDEVVQRQLQCYVQAWQEFSLGLLRQIKLLRLYVQGSLYYQLRQINQRGLLVMEKLEVPMTEENKSARRFTRQADAAYRRYRPRAAEEAEFPRVGTASFESPHGVAGFDLAGALDDLRSGLELRRPRFPK